jgi:hypothetical protein
MYSPGSEEPGVIRRHRDAVGVGNLKPACGWKEQCRDHTDKEVCVPRKQSP